MRDFIAHIREEDQKVQTVKAHLEGTAKRAAEFAEIFGGENAAGVCGLLHDIGKYSDEFYKRITENGPKCDHATAGAKKLYEKNPHLAKLLGPVILGHHGGMPDYGHGADSAEEGTFCARIKKQVPDFRAYQEEFLEEQFTIQKLPAVNFNEDRGFKASFMVRMLFSCLVDADFLDTEQFMANGQIDRTAAADFIKMKKKLEEKTAGFQQDTVVNQWRKKVLDACISAASQKPGMFQLTVPTGGGKTIASAAFAVHHILQNQHLQKEALRRILYVIPYCSIIEQNADVFADIFGSDVVLEHHSNYDFESREDASSDRKKLAAENWDMPLVVTTNVQFFESLYANRPSKCRKLHNIAGSVIIFDEVQAIPTKYLAPCMRAIEELVTEYHCSAVLCSATQPDLTRFFRKEVPVQEIYADTGALFAALQRTRFTHLNSLYMEELAERVAGAKQVLVVLNKKHVVKRFYEMVKQEHAEGVFHLSTNMCPEHRRKVISQIRTRLDQGLSCKVVATNLIEAGVDLDFAQVYREMAGLDSIMQAAGRANRNGKREKLGEVFAFSFAEPENAVSLKTPYGMYLDICRKNAERIISQYDDIFSAEAVAAYFHALYQEFDGAWRDERKILEKIKDFYDNGEGFCFDFQEIDRLFRLIDEDTISILVPYDEAAERFIHQIRSGYYSATKADLRANQKYMVHVRYYEYQQMRKDNRVLAVNDALAILRSGGEAEYGEAVGLQCEVQLGQAVFY